MAGQIKRLAAAREFLQRRHVVAHGAVGRRHDGGRPAHDMVAGEQQIGFLERKRHVIAGVARRRHRFERPAVAAHRLAIGERYVRAKVHVGRCVETVGLADMKRPRGAMRALRVNFCPGRRFDFRHCRRMIAMGMGDEDVADGFAAHRVKQRRDMGVVVGAGIEDGDFAAADDVAHRALEGERPRIIGDHRAHAGRHVAHRVGCEIERLVEGQALVEGNIVAHAGPYRACAAP